MVLVNRHWTTLELFGKKNIEIGTEVCDVAYRVIAVHPE
jgi:hypothetical protein